MARTVTPSRWPEGAARTVVVCVVGSVLSSCMTAAGDRSEPADAGLQVTQSVAATPIEPGPTALIDARLRPAPEEFEVDATAVWDGKRTLQGIWVAHPAAETARRVRIVNVGNGFAVDGALFRRDDSGSGPSVLVSSDAAAALGMVAGEAATLAIVAIRRGPVTVPVAPETAIAQAEEGDEDAEATADAGESGADAAGESVADATDTAPEGADEETVAAVGAGAETPEAEAAEEGRPEADADAAEASATAADDAAPETEAAETWLIAGDEEETTADEAASVPEAVTVPEASAPVTAPVTAPASAALLGLAAIDTGTAPDPEPAADLASETSEALATAPAASPDDASDADAVEPASEAGSTTEQAATEATDAEEDVVAALSDTAQAAAPAPAADLPDQTTVPDASPAEPAGAEPEPADERQAALDPQPAAPSAAQEPSPLGRPFIQAGIFGVESNATRLIAAIESAGFPAEGKPFRSQGRAMTRVIAGPFQTSAERREALRAIRGLGTADAIPVAR